MWYNDCGDNMIVLMLFDYMLVLDFFGLLEEGIIIIFDCEVANTTFC